MWWDQAPKEGGKQRPKTIFLSLSLFKPSYHCNHRTLSLPFFLCYFRFFLSLPKYPNHWSPNIHLKSLCRYPSFIFQNPSLYLSHMATDPNKPTITNDAGPSLVNDDYEEPMASSGCFSCLLCFPCRDNSNNIEHVPLLHGQSNDSWCRKSMKRIKLVSEQLVRPKWKTFVRRFNNSKRQKPQFHYDPRSYALNFDGGVGDEDGGFHRSFFGRFGSSEIRGLESWLCSWPI